MRSLRESQAGSNSSLFVRIQRVVVPARSRPPSRQHPTETDFAGQRLPPPAQLRFPAGPTSGEPVATPVPPNPFRVDWKTKRLDRLADEGVSRARPKTVEPSCDLGVDVLTN